MEIQRHVAEYECSSLAIHDCDHTGTVRGVLLAIDGVDYSAGGGARQAGQWFVLDVRRVGAGRLNARLERECFFARFVGMDEGR